MKCSNEKQSHLASKVNDQRAAASSSQHFWSTIRHGGPSQSKGALPTPRMKQTKKTQQIWQNLHNAKEEAFMKAAQVGLITYPDESMFCVFCWRPYPSQYVQGAVQPDFIPQMEVFYKVTMVVLDSGPVRLLHRPWIESLSKTTMVSGHSVILKIEWDISNSI